MKTGAGTLEDRLHGVEHTPPEPSELGATAVEGRHRGGAQDALGHIRGARNLQEATARLTHAFLFPIAGGRSRRLVVCIMHALFLCGRKTDHEMASASALELRFHPALRGDRKPPTLTRPDRGIGVCRGGRSFAFSTRRRRRARSGTRPNCSGRGGRALRRECPSSRTGPCHAFVYTTSAGE